VLGLIILSVNAVFLANCTVSVFWD